MSESKDKIVIPGTYSKAKYAARTLFGRANDMI